LGNCALTKLPLNIGNLGNTLEILILGGCKLEELPESIGKLTLLRQLDLSGNKMTTLTESIGNLKNLELLNLYGCGLTKLPLNIGNLGNTLQVLNLIGCNLEELPESIGKLTLLRQLDLRGSKMATLPESIGNLKNLELLNLYRCGLTKLPVSMGGLILLKNLILDHNQLSCIPVELGNLISLEVLSLVDNELTSLPNEFDHLQKLTTLNLTLNKIEVLPEKLFKSFEKLVTFNINLNPLDLQTRVMIKGEQLRFPTALIFPFEKKLDQIYNEALKTALLIKMVRFDKTLDFELGENKHYTSRFKVLSEFLERVPSETTFDQEKYLATAKIFMDVILNTEDKINIDNQIAKIATSLGACPNPVRDLLMRTYIGNAIRQNGNIITEELKAILERECLQLEITNTIGELLPNNGIKIDLIVEILDSIYLKDASMHEKNPLRIDVGNDRTNLQLPTKSAFQPFIYSQNQLPDDFKLEFLQLVCSVNSRGLVSEEIDYLRLNANLLLLRLETHTIYKLDEEKIKAIYNKNKFACGAEDKLLPFVNNFNIKLQNLLETSGIAAEYFDVENFKPFLDNSLKNELRMLLEKAYSADKNLEIIPEQYNSIVERFVIDIALKIGVLLDKHDTSNSTTEIARSKSMPNLSDLAKSPREVKNSRSRANSPRQVDPKVKLRH